MLRANWGSNWGSGFIFFHLSAKRKGAGPHTQLFYMDRLTARLYLAGSREQYCYDAVGNPLRRLARPHHRDHNLAGRRTHPGKVGEKEALAEKGGVDTVNVVAFAYDIYTNPSKTTGCSVQRLRFRSSKRPQSEAAKGFHVI